MQRLLLDLVFSENKTGETHTNSMLLRRDRSLPHCPQAAETSDGPPDHGLFLLVFPHLEISRVFFLPTSTLLRGC